MYFRQLDCIYRYKFDHKITIGTLYVSQGIKTTIKQPKPLTSTRTITMSNSTKNFATIYESGAIALYDKYWIGNDIHEKSKSLHGNPSAVNYLRNMNVKFDCKYGFTNPADMERVHENFDDVDYYYLSSNPNAIKELEAKVASDKSKRSLRAPQDKFSACFEKTHSNKYVDKKDPNKISRSRISENPAAIQLLKKNPDLIDWECLCSNPNAIEMIRDDMKKPKGQRKITNPRFIVGNPAAIVEIVKLLKEDPYLVVMSFLFSNPSAIELVEYIYRKYPERINWNSVYENPAAIHLIDEHLQCNNVSNRMLKQLGGYNYWTSYSKEHFNDAVEYTKKDRSWESALDKMFDMSDLDLCALRDLKKYRIVSSFESVNKSLAQRYDLLNTDNVVDRIRSRPYIAKELFKCDYPIYEYEESRLRRNNLAHDEEKYVVNEYSRYEESQKSNNLEYGFTLKEVRDIDNYRTLKHFAYIQALLINTCGLESIWRGDNLPRQIKWDSEIVKNILKNENPEKADTPRKIYDELRFRRNRIAHSF